MIDVSPPRHMTRRGVNFGGWLVLERWITPSVFEGTDAKDEYSFMLTRESRQKLEQHRKTFITESDFQWLDDHDIRLIRIPIGYWALESDEPYLSCHDELDWAMKMANVYNIDVILDVHGLPGSQNGFDHSGQIGRAEWLHDSVLRDKSIAIVVSIANRYKNNPRLWGIQVINEPAVGLVGCKLKAYYRRVGHELEKTLRSHTIIIFSDGFRPKLLSGAMRSIRHPVAMDVHLYHMTTRMSRWRSLNWFFDLTRTRRSLLLRLRKDQPIIIGEWSGVVADEKTRMLSDQQKVKLFQDYVRLQQAVFRGIVVAWAYWTYKTEANDQWNFRHNVDTGTLLFED